MKKLVMVACCLVICLMATSANAVNSLVVESRGFNPSQTLCTLGVWITNDIPLTGFTLPLELRSLSGGAYFTNNLTTTVPFNTQAGGRLINSPLGNADLNGAWPAANITRSAFDVAAPNSCSGPISNSYATAGNNFAPSSPDAVFFATVSQGDPAFEQITLDPGADGAARNQASFRFLFNANANTGCFEIDTCCRTPANHLVGVDVLVNEVLFEFTKGVVSLGGANCSGPPPNTAPNAICQNIQVVANGSCQGTATAAQVNNGSNDAEDGTNLILSLTPAGPYALGANPVQLIVTDQGGLSDTCAATITVVDQTAPVLNCPSNITVQCSADIPAAYANAAALISAGGTVTDNCPNPTVALLDQVSNGQSCPEVITRRYVATDGAGNKDTCTQTVTVDDTQNPVISQCNPDTTVNVPNGTPNAVVSFANLTSASDNCDQSLTYAFSPASGSTFNPGSTQVRVIVSDDCGNSDTCFFSVTVNVLPPENTPPNAICQNIQVSTDSNCLATVSASQVNNGSTDPDGSIQSIVLHPAGPFDIGINGVWLVVTDNLGAVDSCNAMITVVDDVDPEIGCPSDISVACADQVPAPSASLAAFISAGGFAHDNCDQLPDFLHVGDVSDNGSCPEVITRTYRLTDDDGNAAECTQLISINDTIAPSVSCPGNINVTVSTGTTDSVIVYAGASASDNCTTPDVSYSTPSGSSFPVGTTVVTVIATDDCGNADTCEFSVTLTEEVLDAPPVANCAPRTVNADGNCQGSADINNGSFDPDGGSVTLRQVPAGPYGLGQTNVTLWVIDDEGDSTSCSAMVTVNDVTPPIVTCPNDQSVDNDAGECGAIVNYPAATASDNCPGTVDLSYSIESGESFAIGTTTVRVVATDASGNADTCEFNVFVDDTEAPVAVCPGDTAVIVPFGQPSSVVNFSSSATDNCPGAEVVCVPASGSSFPLGVTTVTCTATDASGNTDTCSFTVTVQLSAADTPPIAVCQSINLSAGEFCQASGSIDNGSNDPDGGGVTTAQVPPGPYGVGVHSVQLIVTDNEGDVDTCSATITVRDTTAPVVTCPSDTAIEASGPISVSYVAVAFDACGIDAFTCVPPPGSIFPVGTTTVTCTAVDAAGNSASCSFDVTVQTPGAGTDIVLDIKPRSCPNAVQVERNWGRSNAVLPVAILGTDNFDVHEIDPASLRLEGVAPLRWSYEDVAGPVSDPEGCECTTSGPDGEMDLTLKFRLSDILAAIAPLANGEQPTLTITGLTADGDEVSGGDCILVRGDLSEVGKTSAALPSNFGLTNHPNPFNAATVIQYNLPEDGTARLEVFNILGQSMGVLVNEHQSAGPHAITWDARDEQGSPVPSGLYLYRLQSGAQIETRKMVLLK